MADTVSTKYIYPPKWDGYWPDNSPGVRRAIMVLNCVSDGTGGETKVPKVVRGDWLTTSGNVPSMLGIENVYWDIKGFGVVDLAWDNVPSETILTLKGNASNDIDFTAKYGHPLYPSGENGTGNIIVTTSSDASSGDAYSITLTVRLHD